MIQQVRRRMGELLRFVYRHFPLSNIHSHAEPAAEAAEAAGSQDRFWTYHDRLYEHQDALEAEDLLEHARVVGLDLQRFAGELTAGVHAPRVREDFMTGVRSGVNGTPTFFVNGVRHEGPFDVESLTRAIELALEAS